MDSPKPPFPPPALVMPVPPHPLAYGTRPSWTLVQDQNQVVLTLDRRAPLRLINTGWRDSPAGRRLTMMTGDGRTATLTIIQGLCKPAFGPLPAAMIATLEIDHMRLQGCFVGGG